MGLGLYPPSLFLAALSASATSGFDDLGDYHRSLTGAAEAIFKEVNVRACGEVIDTVQPGEPFLPFPPPNAPEETNTLNYGINALIQGPGALFSDPDITFPAEYPDYYGIFLEAVGRSSADLSQIYNAEYGIKVVKVCGRCDDSELEDKALDAAYEKYCGKQVYGRDATFSGVALIPVDTDGTPLEGAMKGAVSSTSIQTSGFQVASVKWPSDEQGGVGAMARLSVGLYINFVPAMMAAATGKYVGLIVENMGYGESSECFKSTLVKKTYQTPVVPLWLATQDLVADMSDCSTELVNKVVVNGFSEGGFGSLAMSKALDDIGVDVILTQSGSPADVDASTSLGLSAIINSNLSPRYSYTLAMVGSAYSSFSPDMPNHGIPEQTMLAENDRLRIGNWASSNLDVSDVRELVNFAVGVGNPPMNRALVNSKVIASVESTGLICQDPAGYDLEDLCDAISENQILDLLPNVAYPIEICHSPTDDLVPFNQERYLTANNPYVSLKPTLSQWLDGLELPGDGPPPYKNLYTHETSAIACMVMQGWTVVDVEEEAEMTGRCKGGDSSSAPSRSESSAEEDYSSSASSSKSRTKRNSRRKRKNSKESKSKRKSKGKSKGSSSSSS